MDPLAQTLIELGAVVFFLGLLARLAGRIGMSPIPFYLLGGTFHLTGVVSLWLQPKEQAFKTSEMAPGAMAAVTVAKRIFDAFDVTLRVRGKTAGWVPVYASTDPAGDATVGVNVLLP